MLPLFFTKEKKIFSWQQQASRPEKDLLPGGILHQLSSREITAEQKTYKQGLFSLAHRFIRTMRRFRFHITEKSGRPGIRLEAVLAGELTRETEEGQQWTIQAGEYQLTDHPELIALFKGDTACSYFVAHYSAELLEQLGIEELVKSSRPVQMTTEMSGLIQKVLRHPHEEGIRQLHYDKCVRELMLLHLTNKGPALPGRLSHADLAAIYSADHIIRKDLQMPGDIYGLARQAGISETKLKKGFREIFDMAVFERLTWHRMEYAKVLLQTTDRKVEDIALEVGYGSRSSFITAFKAQCRMTPKQWKKNRYPGSRTV